MVQWLTFTDGAALIILRPERRSENAAATALVAVLVLVKATLLAKTELIGKRIIIDYYYFDSDGLIMSIIGGFVMDGKQRLDAFFISRLQQCTHQEVDFFHNHSNE